MKIYLDLIFLLNFGFDFMLLLTVSILLKRRASIKRIIMGAIVGACTIFCLFMNINSLQLFIIKFIMSILMVIITFSYRNIKYLLKNISYLYMASIILGGFLYYLNIEFSYKQEGLIFYHNGLSVNVIFLVIISPFVLYNYVKQGKDSRRINQYYYELKIFMHDSVFSINSYLDTGNVLEDPYFHQPILIINSEIIPENKKTKNIYVPVSTVNHHHIMNCFFVDKIEIVGVGVRKHVLVGISKEKIKLDGVDALLQTKILEG